MSSDTDVYRAVLDKHGIEEQTWMLVEEMGEVMQALSHSRRGRTREDRVLAELIDMQVVLNSVKLHYATDEQWNRKMRAAEERLAKRIRGE